MPDKMSAFDDWLAAHLTESQRLTLARELLPSGWLAVRIPEMWKTAPEGSTAWNVNFEAALALHAAIRERADS